MICPDCQGAKEIAIIPKYNRYGQFIDSIPCYRCEESGEVPDVQETWIHLGNTMRKDRLQRGNTLRKEAEMLGIDAVILSNAERGITDPTRLPIANNESEK